MTILSMRSLILQEAVQVCFAGDQLKLHGNNYTNNGNTVSETDPDKIILMISFHFSNNRYDYKSFWKKKSPLSSDTSCSLHPIAM